MTPINRESTGVQWGRLSPFPGAHSQDTANYAWARLSTRHQENMGLYTGPSFHLWIQARCSPRMHWEQDFKNACWDFWGSPVVKTLCTNAGRLVQSLVGEPRSHKPRGMAKKKKKKKRKQKLMPISHEEQKSKIFRKTGSDDTLCKTCLIGTKQTLFIRTVPTGHNLIIWFKNNNALEIN